MTIRFSKEFLKKTADDVFTIQHECAEQLSKGRKRNLQNTVRYIHDLLEEKITELENGIHG